MRHAPRPPISLGIIALDQRHLIGPLAIDVEPAMPGTVAHAERLAAAVRVHERNGDQVGVGHGGGVGDGERVLEDALDGAPDVDDLVARAQQRVGVGGQGGGCLGGVFGGAADGVVEDEDARGAGAGAMMSLGRTGKGVGRGLRVFEQLLGLGVVLGFDLVVVEEVLLGAGVVVDLEAVAVEGVLLRLTSDVVDGHVDGVERAGEVGLGLADDAWGWLAAVLGILVVVELGCNGYLRGVLPHIYGTQLEPSSCICQMKSHAIDYFIIAMLHCNAGGHHAGENKANGIAADRAHASACLQIKLIVSLIILSQAELSEQVS
ncbi:hypothetical protein FH972_025962 [Carpinus fangiana]|uniref:Uncharacterized protein n=1 Tax=Carpinus fangiana TaxID=176857 RepID=A0A5N6L3I9_9ROSI|nr:hypothetical protein FH972_025962 [Carpinus fangiana]